MSAASAAAVTRLFTALRDRGNESYWSVNRSRQNSNRSERLIGIDRAEATVLGCHLASIASSCVRSHYASSLVLLAADSTHTRRIRVVECEEASDPNRATLRGSERSHQREVQADQLPSTPTVFRDPAARGVNCMPLTVIRTLDR